MSIKYLTELFIDCRVNIEITQISRKLIKALYLENGWKYKKKTIFSVKLNCVVEKMTLCRDVVNKYDVM